MASGELIIDNKLLKAIDTLEKKLQKVSTSSKTASVDIRNMFAKTTPQGIDNLIKKLQNLEKYYQNIGANENKGMKRIAKQAKDAADEINKVIQSLRATQSTNYGSAMRFSSMAKNLAQDREAINRLKQARENLSRTDSEYNKKLNNINNAISTHRQRITSATRSTEELSRAHRGLYNTSDQLTRKLALVFSVSQVQGYLSKIIAVRKEFELQQKALSAIIGDQDKSNELWNQTVALALKSPFRVKELIKYTKQLAAYRIETDQLHDTTKRLADVSAGLGVDMSRIILAYGQVRAAKFLRGTENRQFTEAGIPMLDELAKHFTELEGRAISAGDVFERISKRMVMFEDVAKVFENLTNEGGIFFNMQEKQSETLYGMISNLHDSLDLMMNDIGKGNDGVLKGLVNIAKSLADNWRAVATVLKEVAAAIALMKLAQFYRGIMMVRASQVALAASMSGAAGAAGKMTLAFRTLGNVIKAHPILMIVGVLASAGYALWEYWDAINETNKKYDEMSEREIRRIQKLEDLQSAVEKNNAVLKDAMSTEEARNIAIDDNKKKLEQLKKEYPQLTNEIKVQENGVIQLTDAIKKQNDVWRMNIILQQQAKGGFWQEDALTNYNEALEERAEAEKKLYDARAIAITKLAELEDAYFNKEVKVEDYIRIREILTQISKAKDLTQYNKAFERYNANKDLGFLYEIIGQKVYLEFEEYEDAVGDVFDNVENMMSTFRVRLQEIKTETQGSESPDEQVSRQFGIFVDEALKNIGYADEELRKRVRDYVSEKLQVKLEIAEPEEGGETLENWAENVKAAVTALNEKIKKELPDLKDTYLLPVPTKNDTKESYLNIAKARLEDIKEVYIEGQQMIGEADVKAFDSLKPFADEFERILNISKKASSSGKGKDWFTEMAKSIRDAHKEFNQLSKKLEKTKALKLAIQKNENAFTEAASNAGVDVTLGGFINLDTEDGAISSLLKLLKLVPESAKVAKLNINKFIDDLIGEDSVNKAEKHAERLRDTVENMFSQYEFSIELEKLNIPKDLAKRLFDVDAISLDELREKLEETKPQFVGADQEEEYNKFLKKVDQLEDKQRIERLKKFTEFLSDTVDEIAKVRSQGALDINYAKQLFVDGKLTAEEYVQAIKSIIGEVNEEVSKINLDKFKDSPEYIAAMGNMAGYTVKELKKLSATIQDLINKNANSMGTEEIKSYNDALDKINKRIEELQKPFGKNLIQEIKQIKKLEADLATEKQRQKEQNDTLNKQTAKLLELQNKLAELKSKPQTEDVTAQINNTTAEIQSTQQSISDTNGQLNTTAGNIANIGGQLQGLLGGMWSSLAIVDKIVKTIGQSIQASIQLFNDVKSMMDSFGRDTESGGWAKASIAMEAIGKMNDRAMQGWEDLKSGNVFGAITNTIGVFTSIIEGFNKIHDQKYEDQIQEEIKFVEKLEKAYEKLEKSIDEAYSIDTLKMSYDNAEQNLKEQIAANNRMIELERQKKDTDDERIKEWQEENEKLREALEEQEKEIISKVTAGILDDVLSAADEFTNTWLEAFNETGDGMRGLEDSYGEMMKNMVKRQAAMLITSKFLEQWKNQLDKYINKDDLVLTADEAKNWAGEVQATLPQLNDALKSYFESMKEAGIDIGEGGAGELSGLQKGIQGVTEETALAIEGYLNSIRFFVSEKYRILSDFVTSFSNPEVENPIVSQLKIIAKQTSNIYTLLDSLTAPHPTQTGLGLKVVM